MGFSSNLRTAQVRATVKSIANWTWERYTGKGGKNRGVMQLPETLDTKAKQTLSAKRTHDLRKNSTQARISAAYNNLKQSGKPTTIQQVAKTSGLTRQTVAKYKHLLTETKPASNDVISIQSLFAGCKPNVNYGVHQITAPGGDLGSRFATPLARPSLDGISGFSHAIPPAPQGQKKNQNLKRVPMRAEVEPQLRTLASDCGADPASVSAAVGALHQDIREDSNAD